MLEYINEPFYRYLIIGVIVYHALGKYFPQLESCMIIWIVVINIFSVWFVDILNEYYKESELNKLLIPPSKKNHN